MNPLDIQQKRNIKDWDKGWPKVKPYIFNLRNELDDEDLELEDTTIFIKMTHLNHFLKIVGPNLKLVDLNEKNLKEN